MLSKEEFVKYVEKAKKYSALEKKFSRMFDHLCDTEVVFDRPAYNIYYPAIMDIGHLIAQNMGIPGAAISCTMLFMFIRNKADLDIKDAGELYDNILDDVQRRISSKAYPDYINGIASKTIGESVLLPRDKFSSYVDKLKRYRELELELGATLSEMTWGQECVTPIFSELENVIFNLLEINLDVKEDSIQEDKLFNYVFDRNSEFHTSEQVYDYLTTGILPR